METPSSTRRVTRSQAIFSTNNSDSDSKIPFSLNKTEDSNIKAQEERSALIDITNDSPIVGLAMQTHSSRFVCKKKNSRIKSTPGSGEALLRGQVKTLLHKVEERTELMHTVKILPFIHLVTSPMRLLAPTPEYTPQFPKFSNDEVQIKIASPVIAGHLRTSHVNYASRTLKASEIFIEKEDKSTSITRSLLLDFTDKSALWKERRKKKKKMFVGCVETTTAEFAGIPTPRRKHFRFATEEDEECC